MPEGSQRPAVGAVLSELLAIYRANAGTLLTLAVMIFLPLTLLSEIAARQSVGAGMAVSLAFSGSAAFLYCALVAPLALSPRPQTAEASVGRLWTEASPAFPSLIVGGLVYTLATTIGMLLFIVPGLIMITIWAVAAPVIRFEQANVFAAFARSRDLVKGNGWQVFAILVCTVVIVLAGTIFLQAVAIGIAGEQTGSFVGSWLGVVLAAPMFGLMPTVLYRMLKAARPAESDGAPGGGETPGEAGAAEAPSGDVEAGAAKASPGDGDAGESEAHGERVP